jgi:hypothetical protein
MKLNGFLIIVAYVEMLENQCFTSVFQDETRTFKRQKTDSQRFANRFVEIRSVV